jgi:dienelactone hydrolase
VKGSKYAVFVFLVVLLVACGRDAPEEPDPITSEQPAPTQAAPEVEAAPQEETAPEEKTAPEDQAETEAPAAAPTPEDVSIEAADGLMMAGTFYPGSGDGPWPGVLLLHMNGGRRQDWAEVAPEMAANGYAALAIDMRGFGDTGGSVDWDAAAGDAQAAWAYLAGREDVVESQTAAVGASIGSSMALVAGANEAEINTVVLLSPGLDYFGVTTDDAVVTYGERPLLIVASEEDSLSADSSRALHDLAVGEARLEMYEGAGHGSNMFAAQPELTGLIVEWLDTHVKGQAPAGSAAAGDPTEPLLFDISWDDRSPFRAGLIEDEAAVLDQMAGASIYHMDIALSDDQTGVSGEMQVRYTNQEDVPLEEIYFHLFPNLLGGSSTVSGLTVDGQPVEPEYMPGQGAMRLPLTTPLAPGEQVVVQMAFQVEIPTEPGSNYGVFATIDDVLALAHFYPQISVYDSATSGSGEGWNFEDPPENADVTYADSAYYLVRVTAPAEQVIIASGSEIDSQEEGDSQVVTIAAGPTRDFYIASSDRYEAVSRQVGETTVNSYGFPEFSDGNALALDFAEGALQSFNARFGPYPYTEFDIAPTPNQALGVEYPGIVVIRSALYDPEATLGSTPAGFYLEGTVAHEVGHQWFYSSVGNDQLDEPWVDESLTQYATYLYYVDTYGSGNAEGFRQSFVDRWSRVDTEEIPIGMPAGEYEGAEYSAIVYGRGPLFFEALGEEMGDEAFSAFLRDYYQSNKWGIATGAELKALAEEHCDCDLTPLFTEWVFEQ